MKKLLFTVMVSAIATLWGTAAMAAFTLTRRYQITAGEPMQIPVPIRFEGIYTLSVRSDGEDVDIDVYDSEGTQIGVSDQIGNDSEGTQIGVSDQIGTDSFTGNLAVGDYSASVDMDSCSDLSDSCFVEFVIIFPDDMLTRTD
ncbi:MAG: hypothetical protein AAFQ63_20210 [Cyanobacteria bacterium J06621_11]